VGFDGWGTYEEGVGDYVDWFPAVEFGQWTEEYYVKKELRGSKHGPIARPRTNVVKPRIASTSLTWNSLLS
jgi:hypothetical protein